MIVEAKVIKSFRHTNTGIVWFEGDVFKGRHDDAAQLAEMGFLDFDGCAPSEAGADADWAAMTVAELSAACAERGIEVPKKARKAELVELLAAAAG